MRLLIVDDSPTNLKLLRAQLEAEGHGVLEAANGVEALKLLDRESVDGVISDILMPGMDGFRLCLEIRKSKVFSRLPFVFYTSTYKSPQDQELARTVGGDRYITKPSPVRVILSAVEEAMQMTRGRIAVSAARHDEGYVLKQYNEALVRKLEERNVELEEAVRRLESAQQAIRESERRFSDMLGKVELVSLMLDQKARITYCNDYLLRLSGWQRDQVIGRNWFDIFIPPDAEILKDVFAALIADQPQAWHHENEIVTRSGERRLVRWNNTVLRSASGEVIGTASIGEDITEQKKAEFSIRRLNRVYAVLSGINTLIVRVRDRQQLFDKACRIAVEQGNFGMAWLGMLDSTTLDVTPVAWAGLGADEYLGGAKSSIRENLLTGQGILAQAIKTRKPVFDNDITKRPDVGGSRRKEAIRLGYRSFITLPLIVEAQVVGILSLFAKEADFFNEEELKLLSELAGDISFAMEHISGQIKIEKLSRIRVISSEINSAIVRAQSKQELFEAACKIAVEQARLGSAWAGVLDAATLDITPVAWAGEGSDEMYRAKSTARDDPPRGQGAVSRAVRERRAVINNDLSRESFGGPRLNAVLKLGLRSIIALPLFEGDAVAGTLTLYAKEPEFFDDEEVSLLTEVAGNISFALEHMARQDKIEKLSRIRAVSSEVNSAIVRIRERETLLQETCRIAAEHGKFELVWVGEIDSEKQKVRPVASMGFSLEATHAVSWASISGAQGTLGEAIRTRKPAVRNDIQSELPTGKLRQEALKQGCYSTVCLPLVVDNSVAALIVLFAPGTGFFDEDELALLSEMTADVSFALQSIAQQEKVEFLSYYDTVTGLPNRRLFMDRAGQQMRSREGEPLMVALILVNLERFRNINESFGRQGGDTLLTLVAHRLETALHGKDYLARIGADNFGVVIRGVRDGPALVHAVDSQILGCFKDPFSIDGKELRVAARAGVALYPEDGGDADTLFRNAEAALKRARASGDSCLFYAAEMNAKAAQALSMETRLRNAVEAQQFVLHYQPKIDLASGRISGLEALIRWQDPESGLVAPGAFIPLLEETGLIRAVGRWALAQALAQHREWTSRGHTVPRIAVNVSAIQLQQRDFSDIVSGVVQEGNANPDALELEITESLLMRNVQESIHKLSVLRGLGIHIAMDDFGTGYSSLSYIARLPIHSLKIDRSFISGMGSSPQDMSIVSTIIGLARSLNLKVVAEGVETEDQAKLLRLLKCDEAQGYLFSKPLPATEIEPLLRAKTQAR